MPHYLDIGRSRFRDLVSATPNKAPRLPMVHSTDSYVLEDILGTGKIAPQSCSVFTGEALTYFFYGRPAFRPNLDEKPISLMHYFPVCILFRPDWSANIKRVFPFDSGAFQNGLYASYLHKRMRLGDFGLEANEESLGKVVSMFFGSNSAYMRGKPKSAIEVDQSQFEAQSYLALINARESNALDNRSSAVEAQTSQPISIEESVSAVILPSSFIDGQTGLKLARLQIATFPYQIFERSRPSEYMSKIAELCQQYYERLHLIEAGVV